MASDLSTITLNYSNSELIEFQSESEEDTESLASLDTDDGNEHPPEKIIADEIDKAGNFIYLVKWKDCSILRSSWEDFEFCCSYPEIYNEWRLEKERINRGEAKALDLEDFNKRAFELELKERLRRNPEMYIIWQRVTCGFLFFTSFALANTESPSSDTELICSPTSSTDCYPKIFQPTINFQNIREGQDIPHGLHVRMNIYTGEKEARLNIPMADEASTANEIQALPIEISMTDFNGLTDQKNPDLPKISIEQESHRPDTDEKSNSEGKIQIPASTDELHTFQQSLTILKSRESSFVQALDDLSELSHDIYYGRELAEDGVIVEMLVCLTLGLELDNVPIAQINVERLAASILNSALQNNPAALKGAAKNIRKIIYPSCNSNKTNEVGEENNFITTLQRNTEQINDPLILRTKVTTLSRLLKIESFRDFFLENKGIELLFILFSKNSEDFRMLKRRIGELLMENFLDDSLGAHLNSWPKFQQKSVAFCEKNQIDFEECCWEYHIEQFSAQYPTEDWPNELLLAMKNRRPKAYKSKSEL
ncbi:Nucleotide exchange factor SIL1 [Golovinomyces cichoracearum]|uniref:Nucleotide exchange factor SIL1 n=1 Tax=Golovinomyces cichoracearum TaxID=62708 RepID=A0A420IR87_9PEZI|nr:Nucleotide exchange factor SIL1 [Golovinomyces cichoracearum]